MSETHRILRFLVVGDLRNGRLCLVDDVVKLDGPGNHLPLHGDGGRQLIEVGKESVRIGNVVKTYRLARFKVMDRSLDSGSLGRSITPSVSRSSAGFEIYLGSARGCNPSSR